ncbi:hypothetical protein B0H13DRAFT_2423359, partial [Mycena leptocephala]
GLSPELTAWIAGGLGPEVTAWIAGGLGPEVTAWIAGGLGPEVTAWIAGGLSPELTAWIAGGLGPEVTAWIAGGLSPELIAWIAGGLGPEVTAWVAGLGGYDASPELPGKKGLSVNLEKMSIARQRGTVTQLVAPQSPLRGLLLDRRVVRKNTRSGKKIGVIDIWAFRVVKSQQAVDHKHHEECMAKQKKESKWKDVRALGEGEGPRTALMMVREQKDLLTSASRRS